MEVYQRILIFPRGNLYLFDQNGRNVIPIPEEYHMGSFPAYNRRTSTEGDGNIPIPGTSG